MPDLIKNPSDVADGGRNLIPKSSMRTGTPTQDAYSRMYDMTLREWILWHHEHTRFRTMHWMGVPMVKNPLDAWILSEIVYEVKPERIVEIGSGEGGTTLYLANLLDIIGTGRVVAIDINKEIFIPKHKRIIRIIGDSHSESTFKKTSEACRGKSVLVIHDADHTKNSVADDLRNYSRLVTLRRYFIVEDGILDLFEPTALRGGVEEGPLGAIEAFLSENPNFEVDGRWERYIITYNPKGYLRRIR